jgi:hypothetical protein
VSRSIVAIALVAAATLFALENRTRKIKLRFASVTFHPRFVWLVGGALVLGIVIGFFAGRRSGHKSGRKAAARASRH